MTSRTPAPTRKLSDIAVFIVGVALLCLPAIYNRYPLFYPDAVGYIRLGPRIARAVFLLQPDDAYGYRSAWYMLSILPLHWMATPWPIIIFHAAVTVYMLRVTLRMVVPAITRTGELLIYTVLATVTSAGWYVSLVQPDFLTPLAILGCFLIAIYWRELARVYRLGVCAVLWYAIVSHSSHLPLAMGLFGVAVIWHLLCRSSWCVLGRQVAPIAVVIVIAVASQLTIHVPMYGRLTLFGKGLPFMMARTIADGPGADYLREHGDEHDWAICEYRDRLPKTLNEFLWDRSGIWQTADESTRDRLRNEESELIAAVLRTYPWRQAKVTLSNIASQARSFDLWTFGKYQSLPAEFRLFIPRMTGDYMRGKQAKGKLPLEQLSAVCRRVIYLSVLIVLLLLIAHYWQYGRPAPLLGMTLFVVLGIAGNLALGASLSVATDRLHARDIWLIPLLAMVCIAAFVTRRRQQQQTQSQP